MACMLVAQMVGYKCPPRWLHLVGFVVCCELSKICVSAIVPMWWEPIWVSRVDLCSADPPWFYVRVTGLRVPLPLDVVDEGMP